ncbi:hypothetical protein [Pseudomonas sp.]|jgi:hypothetical protein|nr:hypothetical protein [Pseudomonas sp.]
MNTVKTSMPKPVSKLTPQQRAANRRVGAVLFLIVAGFFLATILNHVHSG